MIRSEVNPSPPPQSSVAAAELSWQQSSRTPSAIRWSCADCRTSAFAASRPRQPRATFRSSLAAQLHRPHADREVPRPALTPGAAAGGENSTRQPVTLPIRSATWRRLAARAVAQVRFQGVDGNDWRLRRPLPLLFSAALSLFGGAEIPSGLEPGAEQIAADRQIHEVILSGGDPLVLVDEHLAQLVARIAEISHVRRLRVHTRLPIIIPQRVTRSLIDALSNARLENDRGDSCQSRPGDRQRGCRIAGEPVRGRNAAVESIGAVARSE